MNIEKLCEPYDVATRSVTGRSAVHLYLVGWGGSVFLRAIAKKATSLGVTYSFRENIPDTKTPTVVDKESYRGRTPLYPNQDIDRINNGGMSCCAEAVRTVLATLGVKGKVVCIIGRGHAVQGLARELVDMDATVTVAHSKTPSLYEATRFADILVVAAPIGPAQVGYLTGQTVVDLVGTFRDFVSPENYIGDIGKLTTSVVLHRAAHVQI